MSKANNSLSYEEALEKVLAYGHPLEAEELSFMDAQGRVLAEDVYSDIDVSPFDNSAMDGFAVRVKDLEQASVDHPVSLKVIELIPAGKVSQLEVTPGTCSRIMTGAAMPEGADTVIKIEQSSAAQGGGSVGDFVSFTEASSIGANVRYAGEEVKAGGVILAKGECIDVAGIGLLAATGNTVVKVHRKPVVGIISTGSELIEPDKKPQRGQIRNSNSYANAAQAIDSGAEVITYPIVEDSYETTLEAFKKASEECDILITSGGVSVGDFDFVKPALESLGVLEFSKVNMRPGNPQTMGQIGKAFFFGLPGNPSSCYVGFEAFLRPLIRKMLGHTKLKRMRVQAVLDQDIDKRQARKYFLRGKVEKDEKGTWHANLPYSQSSALLTAAHYGNAFVILPEGEAKIEKNSLVECWLLNTEEL